MKAWLADAVILGGGFTLLYNLISDAGIGESAFAGVLFGVTMASLAVWRHWPTIGRRRFAKLS
jgi:hypothetical protein